MLYHAYMWEWGSACRQASLCHAIMYTNMCLFEYAFLCMYVHWHVPMCAPVLVTVWVNSRHEYTLNSRLHECPYYGVYRHISEGMLSHGHMFIGEECKNACMCVCTCVCAHVFVCDMVGVKADYTCMIPSDKLLDSLSLTALSCKSGVLKAKFSALGTSLRLHWISTCMCGPYRK